MNKLTLVTLYLFCLFFSSISEATCDGTAKNQNNCNYGVGYFTSLTTPNSFTIGTTTPTWSVSKTNTTNSGNSVALNDANVEFIFSGGAIIYGRRATNMANGSTSTIFGGEGRNDSGTNYLWGQINIMSDVATAGSESGGVDIRTSDAGSMVSRLKINSSGSTFSVPMVGMTGTTTSAPINIPSGTLKTTPVSGDIEHATDDYYATIATGAARKKLVLAEGTLTSGRVPVSTTNGRLTDDAGLLYDTATDTLTSGPHSIGGHIISTGTAPALSACGTSPSITGTDSKGTVTEGTIATGCTITFATAYASAPACVVSSRAGLGFTYTTSTTAITITNVGALSSTGLDYICMQ